MEEPKLVIADEPTPGLELATARRVMGHFKEIAEEGASVLLITHDLELALETADRIMVSVSYTHLDVYKRQGTLHDIRNGLLHCKERSDDGRHHKDYIDVYKRQAPCRRFLLWRRA